MQSQAEKNEYQRRWRAANREHVNAQARKYAAQNVDKIIERNRARRLADPEKFNAARRDHYAKNPQKFRDIQAQNRKNNPELFIARTVAWQKRNPEKTKINAAKHARRHPHKMNARTARRRAAKLQATPGWANEFIIEEAYHLAKLRTKVMGFKWNADHIVPLVSKKVCGLHVEHNLQVVPAKLNLIKGNKTWPQMPV